MKQIYLNKIFNWVLLATTIITLIDSSYLLTKDFEYYNVLVLRIVLFVISVLSLLSFFVDKLNKEFYSRLFILANFIIITFAIYYRFLIDQLIYMITRTELISNPAIHLKFVTGILLFYFSIKFSKNSSFQREEEYGIMITICGVFSIMISCSKLFHLDSYNFSIIIFVIGILLSSAIILMGILLRLRKVKFKKCLILTLLLAIVYAAL